MDSTTLAKSRLNGHLDRHSAENSPEHTSAHDVAGHISGKVVTCSLRCCALTASSDYEQYCKAPWKDSAPSLKTSIWKMPSELIGMILDELHRQDCPMTPVMLSCRTLYDIISSTPKLWRRILISVDSMPLSLKTGSTMACQTEEFLEKVLQLAGNTQLEATLVIGQINTQSPEPYIRAKRYRMLLKYSKRISFLCIIINPGTPLDVVISSFQEIFTDGFESLESLMIASAVPLSGLLPAFQGLLNQIESTSTKLGSLYFENLQKDFIMAARAFKFWRSLRRVTLKGEYQPLHATVYEGCEKLDFLSFTGELLVTADEALPPLSANALEPTNADSTATISPSSRLNSLNDDPNRQVELPKVQWLRLGAITMNGLSLLRIPHIRFLVIQTALRDHAFVTPPLHSVIFPELEVLHIAAVHTDIGCIVAPNLQTLCLQIQALKRHDANHIIMTLFDNHDLMWRPRNLSISAPVHDKHLVSVLKRLPGVESLTLTLQDMPKNTLFAALRRHRVLPKLQSLSLDFHAMGAGDRERKELISPKIQDIAQSRQKAGVPLQWFSWKWGIAEEVVVRKDFCPQCYGR